MRGVSGENPRRNPPAFPGGRLHVFEPGGGRRRPVRGHNPSWPGRATAPRRAAAGRVVADADPAAKAQATVSAAGTLGAPEAVVGPAPSAKDSVRRFEKAMDESRITRATPAIGKRIAGW